MFSILHVIVKTKTFFTEVIIHRTFFSSNKWLNRSPIIQRLYFFLCATEIKIKEEIVSSQPDDRQDSKLVY